MAVAVRKISRRSFEDVVIADQGALNCSTNPNYPAASAGQTYTVSVAGKIGGASGDDVLAGDWLRCVATSAAGDQATVGGNWRILRAVANMTQGRIKGRPAGGGTGPPVDLTSAQATAILDVMVGDSGSGGTKGMVSAPAAGDAAAGKVWGAGAAWVLPNNLFSLDGNGDIYIKDVSSAPTGTYITSGMARLTTVRHSTPSYGYREMYVKLGAANTAFDIADSVQGSWYDVNGAAYFTAWWLALSPKKGKKRNTTTGAVEDVSPDTRTGYGGAAEINFQNRWANDGFKHKASTFGTTGGMATLGVQIVPEAQNFDGLMGADGYHLNAALLIGRSSDTSAAISDKAKSYAGVLIDPNAIAPDGYGIYINGNDADTSAGGSADDSKSPLAAIGLRGTFDIGIDFRDAVTHSATMVAIPNLYRVTWAYDGGTNQVDLESATDGGTKKLVCSKRFQAAGFLTSSDILPTTTESFDLGSASFEFDNCFLQNAVTVSDARRKNDLGTIDGDQALALLMKIEPRWYTYKDAVIPAHTRMETQMQNVVIPERVERRMKEGPEDEDTRARLESDLADQLARIDAAYAEDDETDAFRMEQLRDAKERARAETLMRRRKSKKIEYEDYVVPEHTEQRLVEVEVEVPEQVVRHGRPHAGFFAQQVKEAMTAVGIEDFAAYAYDADTDTHFLRLMELIAVQSAAIRRLDERVTELQAGGGKPA